MWTFTFDDDHVLSLDDLTPSQYQSIAAKHGLFWMDLWDVPHRNYDALYDVIVARAELAGIAPPVLESMRDVRTVIVPNLEQVEEDDRPKAGTTEESPAPEPDVPETT